MKLSHESWPLEGGAGFLKNALRPTDNYRTALDNFTTNRTVRFDVTRFQTTGSCRGAIIIQCRFRA